MINQARRIVFFGGAGVSTESGIPDFRSADGLYNQKYPWSPEVILSHSFFLQRPAEFFRFYRDKMLPLAAQPNAAHKKLAELERAGKLNAVITQNIDGLHSKAGSKAVYELHGSIWRNHCMRCHRFFGPEALLTESEIPRCSCGGVIKPDVVLYEEGLDEETISGAVDALRTADLLIVAGTSLTVYPAAGLLHDFHGEHLVLINRDATPFDSRADLVLRENVGAVMSKIQVNAAP